MLYLVRGSQVYSYNFWHDVDIDANTLIYANDANIYSIRVISVYLYIGVALIIFALRLSLSRVLVSYHRAGSRARLLPQWFPAARLIPLL